jgi:hypothetical protein
MLNSTIEQIWILYGQVPRSVVGLNVYIVLWCSRSRPANKLLPVKYTPHRILPVRAHGIVGPCANNCRRRATQSTSASRILRRETERRKDACASSNTQNFDSVSRQTRVLTYGSLGLRSEISPEVARQSDRTRTMVAKDSLSGPIIRMHASQNIRSA